MHPQLEWAMQAGVLTWSEAMRLAELDPWDTEETVDRETAAAMRRYLYWLGWTDRSH